MMPLLKKIPARAVAALNSFFRYEASGGMLLIAAAALALLLANSPLDQLYDELLAVPVEVRVGALQIAKPLLLWINDGLMAVFFLLVALEVKREALHGQLSSREQLVLPLACAAGGIAVPAAIYVAMNHADPIAMGGWAIPTATDIAFALGILSLLGSRAPLALKVLLSAIAVIDDLAAIVIIAVFYAGSLSLVALVGAAVSLALMLLMNRLGVKRISAYVLVGIVMWVFVLKSGVHATLAGVATGLMIPMGDPADPDDTPLETLEHALHPWVAFGILPLFAFANAGVSLSGVGKHQHARVEMPPPDGQIELTRAQRVASVCGGFGHFPVRRLRRESLGMGMVRRHATNRRSSAGAGTSMRQGLLAQLALQRTAVHAQAARRSRYVAVLFGQHPLQVLPFETAR
jgi:NhaA family Na+:H+ antiporter